MKKEWKDFLESYLSLEGLFSSLGLLLESGRLAPRGFSVPKVPLATEGMRLFLGGWYLASLDDKLGKKLVDEGLEKAEKELRETLKNRPLGNEIIKTAARFGKTAKNQLNTNRPDIRRKLVDALHHILEEPLVPIPPPLFKKPPILKARPPGDRAKVCYGCGQPIEKGYGVSKMIFASPSQRLQSGYGQEEPEVCGTCAVLGLVSPLKFGEGAVLVRVRAPRASLEEAKAFTRMVVLGSLNVAAGPYILLNSPSVRAGDKRRPLAQVVGRVIYALAHIGQEVNPRVLQKLDWEVLEGEQAIPLPKAALWLSHLYQVGFRARIVDEGGEANRDLAEALRYALDGLPWHGEYVLARRYGRVADPIRLEAGRRDYAELLAGGRSMGKLAERFKDVASLTGLLYAWADYIRGHLEKKGKNPRREIAKFLENLESPYLASYVASHTLDATQATLYRAPQHHFLYEEALRLLREAGVKPNEKEEKLFVSQDDLAKAYTHLAQKYEGEWKKFIYEVRLALASCFPEYIRAEKEE